MASIIRCIIFDSDFLFIFSLLILFFNCRAGSGNSTQNEHQIGDFNFRAYISLFYFKISGTEKNNIIICAGIQLIYNYG